MTDIVQHSTRHTDLARQVFAETLGVAPWLDDPTYTSALRSFAIAEATVTLLRWRLERAGGEDVDLLGELRRWTALASRERQELGLTPVSRQRLGKGGNRSKTLLDLWAEEAEAPSTRAMCVRCARLTGSKYIKKMVCVTV